MGANGRIAALEVLRARGRQGRLTMADSVRRGHRRRRPQRARHRRLPRRAGRRVLVLERRERVGGAAETAELGGVRVPRLADTVGRLRPSVVQDLDLRSHGLRLVAPDVRVFAPQPDGRAVTLWSDQARTVDGLRAWSAHDADAYPDFDRLVRSLGVVPRRARRRDPARHQVARSRRRADGPEAGAHVPRARQARRAHDPAGAADGGRRLRRGGVRDRCRSGRRSPGAACAARSWGRGPPARPRSSSATPPATTAAPPGRPCSRSAARVRCRRRSPASARAAGAEIRCGADVTAITARDNRVTGVALASGEEIAAPVDRLRARPEADADRASSTR